MSILSPMQRWTHWALVLTLCAAAATAAPRPLAKAAPPAAPARNPFNDLPLTHPAYATLNHLEQAGIFVGYPTGWFSGKRALTPYDFAVAGQRMLSELRRAVEALERGALPVVRSAQGAAQEGGFSQLVQSLQRPADADRILTWFEALLVEFREVFGMLGQRPVRWEIRKWRETLCADAPGL